MKNIFLIISLFVCCLTVFANSNFSTAEYLRRCEATPILSKNISYCREAVQNNTRQIQRDVNRISEETKRLENKTVNPQSSQQDNEKRGRIRASALEVADRLEATERVHKTVSLDEEIKQTDYEIQSLERYLSQLDVNTPEENKTKLAYKDNIAIHQANLAELRKKSNELWQERLTRTAALNQNDSIAGQQPPNPTQGFVPVENAPAQTVSPAPAPISQSSSSSLAPAREVREISLSELEREVSQQEINSLNRQIARRDVENRFDSLRLQNAGLQVRLSALQRRYDNALMGHYIKAKFGKLLQADVFCEKADKCSSNSTTDISDLDSKVNTQIFKEVK